jgi:excisionase family DNA binding protein
LTQWLTALETADLLGVSRPTPLKLLEDGKVPFEQPGRHRRMRLDDVLAYRDQRHQERSEALDELVRQTDALGLYDEEAPEVLRDHCADQFQATDEERAELLESG